MYVPMTSPNLCCSAWNKSYWSPGQDSGNHNQVGRSPRQPNASDSAGDPIHGPYWGRFQAEMVTVQRGLGGGKVSLWAVPLSSAGPSCLYLTLGP